MTSPARYLAALAGTLFCVLNSDALAAPVAVNDSYSTNEDTPLVISTAPFITEAFDSIVDTTDTRGFNFQTNIFGLGSGQGGQGGANDIEGTPPGGLDVRQAASGTTAITRNSGWNRTFNVATAQTVRVTINYRLTTDSVLSDAAVATVRLRIGTTGTITTVDQVTGKNKDTGWKTATYTFAVTAGAQTLQFGATATNNNVTGSTIRAYFDNVRVEPAGNTGVLANDTGGAVSATLNTPPANGTLLFNVNGTFTYTPSANFSGADSFTYRASDGTATSNVGTVSLNVNAVNDAPVAVANSYTTTESVTLNVPANQGVLINDTDVEGQALTAALVAQATRGTVTLNANGSFSYVPNPGISGSDSFTYRASDGTANSNTVAVTITILPVNDPPIAVNDSYTATKNQILNITATSGSGSATLVAAGATWKYLDNGSNQNTAWKEPGFSDATWKSGLAEFGYGEGDEATVVEDDATPGSPTPNSTTRYVTTYFRQTFTVSDKASLHDFVLSVKRDDGAVVYLNGTVISDTTIQNGLPNAPAFDTLASSATNDGQTFITVTPANVDTLLVEGTNVIAVEIHQSAQDSSDISFDLSLTATRGGSETLVATGENWRYLDNGTDQGVAWHGLTFPDTTWKSGPAELGYGDGDEATVVEDDATPGSPTAGSTTRYITTYFRHKFTVTNKTSLTDLVLSVKRDDGAVVYLNGTVISDATIQNGLINNPGYLDGATNDPDDGAAFHTVNLQNGQDLLLEGENILAVEVHQQNGSSSDISFNLSLVAVRSSPAGVLANDIEPDGQTLSATLITPPTHGTLQLNTNGTFSYTPAANYVGLDSFVYAASDGSFSSNATATITVSTGPNSAPVAVNDAYTVTEDTVLTVGTATGVLANDTDAENDPLTAVIAIQAAHGTVALATNGSFTYTPSPNFFGQDSFTYRAADPFANSIPATVSLTVNGTPDAPVAVADNYATDRGAPLIVPATSGVLANDSDADGQTIVAELVNGPSSGNLSLSPNGAFTYTPAAGFSGTATFTYRANDGTLTSSTVTVSILVNSRPIAVPDTYAATEDTTLNVPAAGVLANDNDPDGEPITAVLVANAANGTVTLNSNGSFAYVPATNFNGTDTFTYRATDGARNSADVTVTINVAAVNDAPIAVNDQYDIPIGEETKVSAAVGVLANDTDPDAPSLSAQLVSSPTSGNLVWNADGSFQFTPLAGFTGVVTFTYRASDGISSSAAATVTLNVQNQAAVLISEIMFNAASGQPSDEWIEVRNTGTTPVSIRGWKFTNGVDFTFPDRQLAAGGFIVVAANLPAFQVLFPAVTNVVGPWTGTLSNRGERIELENAVGRTIDSLHYADQGDWADRRAEVLGGQSGWAWISGADGTGQSLQLRNAALPNDNGQNWASATPTPGAANTAVASTNLAPLIYDVKQSPELPSPTDQVHVTATFVDDSAVAPTARVTYRTWTRPAATDTTSTPTAWVDSTMFDDGLHSDGVAGDGTFGATIPAFPANTIVEFYVRVTDGTNVRTWPAPTATDGTQGANCLYFVEAPTNPGTRPFYRFVMTGQDEINFRFDNWPSGSDAALNTTFVAQQGGDVAVRYSSSIRIRGASSRDRSPRNWRLDIPHDNDWQDRVSINLNAQFIYNQLLGSRLMELAGLAREEATIVQVWLNGLNHATDNQNNRRFGYYIDLKPLNSDFVDEQYPNDNDGNAYRKVRPDNKWAPRGAAGTPNVANYISDGWAKETNGTINDWTDLHALLRAFTDTAAGAGYYPAISTVADVDEFVRWFAVCTIINHRETNISNGSDDDYSLYRGTIDSRFKLIGHDFDTVFGIGDTSTVATAGIYQVIDGFGGTTIPVFTKFFQNPTIARKYKAQLRLLLDTVFEPANFNGVVDALLPTDWIPAPHGIPGGGVPENIQTTIKDFMATRRAHIYSLIPQAFTATTSLAVQNGFPTTTNATNTSLSGTIDAAITAKVTVNGAAVTVDNYAGTWSAGSAVTLQPGLNTLDCAAFDENDQQIASATVQIVYERGTTSTEGGTLNANDVWTVAGGPYSVTSNLTIASGVTLTIEPGASVFLTPGTSFTVAAGGRLLAEGTPDTPITFSKAPAATGTWSGLVINGGAGDLESRLRYVIFDSNGGAAVTAQNGARVILEGLTFRNTAQPYLVLNGSSFELSDTVFPNATAAFAPVSGSGIAAGGQAIIRDCVFGTPMGANSALTFTGGERPGPILQVLRNAFNGSPANLVHLHGADAWIEDNVLMHCHRNSTAPSASAVSGDDNAGDPGAVTMVRNYFYDCDHAVTMREGCAFALLNNTVVHITNAGGTDTAAGVVNLANGTETPGAGGRVEANIIWDATALARRYNSSLTDLKLNANLLPVPWNGPGANNEVADPLLNLSLIPTPAVATEEQVRAAFVPETASPAIATGLFGLDKGALVPGGIALGGVPVSPTPDSGASLVGGPAGSFPPAYRYGYTELKYSVDGGPFSASVPTTTPISLSGLTPGEHAVSVLGRNDAGVWQTIPTVATWTITPGVITVVINEVLASNVGAYTLNGSHPDIIEIYNYGSAKVDLSNFSVSDDPSNPRRFVFPAGFTISADQYILLFGDTLTANLGFHIGFGMDTEGDSFALYRPDAVDGSEPVDSVSFGAQIDNYSIARSGRDRAWRLSRFTPGSANVAVTQLGDSTGLRINEWLSANQIVSAEDFLELYNPATKPVALGGLHLTDDLGNYPMQHEIAPLSFIGAGGFTHFIADGNPDQGPQHLSFAISRVHETLSLTDASGFVLDQVPVVSQTEDQSQGRTPDGSETLAFFPLPTPGYSNLTYTPAQSTAFQNVINNLRITEIMFDPSSSARAEFIELKNISTTLTLDLSGISFANGITHTFPAGTTLAPGAYLVLTENLTRFQSQFPGVAATQWTSGKLDNSGERLRLEISPYELGILDFEYSDNWYPTTAGAGASLQFIDPLQPRTTWGKAESWQPSSVPTPGTAPTFAVGAGPDLVVQPGLSAVLRGDVVYASFAANTVTFSWSVVSGPGTVVFTAPSALNTDASFSNPGVYVLAVTARESGGNTTVQDTVEVIAAEAFSSWTARTITDPALRAPTVDAEKDGLINILEFAYGLNPQVFSSNPVELGAEGDNLTLTYRRDRSAGGLTYTVQESVNLPAWSAANAKEDVIATNGTVDVIKATVPKIPGLRQFLRLQVSY